MIELYSHTTVMDKERGGPCPRAARLGPHGCHSANEGRVRRQPIIQNEAAYRQECATHTARSRKGNTDKAGRHGESRQAERITERNKSEGEGRAQEWVGGSRQLSAKELASAARQLATAQVAKVSSQQ